MTENNNKKINKIKIDEKACIGAATCIIIAPKAFELNHEGIAKLKNTATESSEEELIKAAKSCPTGAIKLFDEKGNQIV